MPIPVATPTPRVGGWECHTVHLLPPPLTKMKETLALPI